ncbi:Txe/YoeB family addiction module toxin [Bacteroidales bacterium OttesenSCG-928-I21]|nr:Txe/YoeB family addiction module toxin [Bacteroidales bacterium OttesenSCG-928-I21]
MEVVFKDKALRDLKYWKKSGNKQVQKKISELIVDIQKHPETGLGKPEALKYDLSGMWSRKINDEHRLTYNIEGNVINIASLRGHYFDK